jgi:hypothetical protein
MPFANLRFTERDDLSPICPYCEKYLDEIYVKRAGITGGGPVCFCPFCLKLLAVSDAG